MTRIIAGEARGRTIKVPEAGTRPTSDRAREGLFSSLNVRWGFIDSRVLDLFAGSGALGLEAASRGAEEVVLVENNAAAVKIIRHNIGVVKHPRVEVREMKASSYLASVGLPIEDAVLGWAIERRSQASDLSRLLRRAWYRRSSLALSSG